MTKKFRFQKNNKSFKNKINNHKPITCNITKNQKMSKTTKK